MFDSNVKSIGWIIIPIHQYHVYYFVFCSFPWNSLVNWRRIELVYGRLQVACYLNEYSSVPPTFISATEKNRQTTCSQAGSWHLIITTPGHSISHHVIWEISSPPLTVQWLPSVRITRWRVKRNSLSAVRDYDSRVFQKFCSTFHTFACYLPTPGYHFFSRPLSA